MKRVAVVTGTRAEYGLLAPVIDALGEHTDVQPYVIAAGAHLIGDSPTVREIERSHPIAERVPMQEAGQSGRAADARAFGKGVAGFAEAFGRINPEVVLVLGDRIEAFAAAAAASIGGWACAHMHGGDRAEGVADEAMRHAITKLAHLHLPATEQSAQRIVAMGEEEWRVRTVGSPAADTALTTSPMSEEDADRLGDPSALVLHHPAGLGVERESAMARAIAEAMVGERVVWLAPNFDPDREAVQRVREEVIASRAMVRVEHLSAEHYRGLIARLARSGGVLVGNSSSALIEAAILGCPAVDVGPRQGGRERCANVVHVAEQGLTAQRVRDAIDEARNRDLDGVDHPYGDGRTGERVARVIAEARFSDQEWLRKRNSY